MDTIASLTEQEEERELFQSMVTVEKRLSIWEIKQAHSHANLHRPGTIPETSTKSITL